MSIYIAIIAASAVGFLISIAIDGIKSLGGHDYYEL
jgi:hypothetical protein